MNTRYEIQTFTLCGGWVNTWLIIEADNTETSETFATEDEAQQILTELNAVAADSETLIGLPRIFQVWGKRANGY